ncbi:MAG: regulatory protein RecX [Pseudomonadota bacterium]
MKSASNKHRDRIEPRERVDGAPVPATQSSPRNAAMDLLARREHSRFELRRKLERRFPPEGLIDALEQLENEGLQSDVRFAQSFTRERLLKAYGPRRVRAELRQRGVADEVISDVLKSVPSAEGLSWSAQARAALRRRFGDATNSHSNDTGTSGTPAGWGGSGGSGKGEYASAAKEKARRLRYLYQRGFSTDDCADVVADDAG